MTLRTAILVSLGCCIPAAISLIAMWQKLLHANAKKLGWPGLAPANSMREKASRRARNSSTPTEPDITRVEAFIVHFLRVVEYLVFAFLFLAVVVLGEVNFSSHEMLIGVEPMAAVGTSDTLNVLSRL